MRTLEEFKAEYKDPARLKSDEFLKDGLPHCKRCGQPRFYHDEVLTMWSMCECLRRENEERERKEERMQRLKEFYERQDLSLIGNRYKGIFFAKAKITESNKKAYEKCKNYANNALEVIEENIGLYVYGDNSSGKTYLTACLCNELVWRGFRCLYTNLASVLNMIRDGYDRNGVGETELLRRIEYYDFLFLDDLGKEFIGREGNPAIAKWAEGKLFEILNARYNAKKPTIFSSNYSIGELIDCLSLDKAIVERINEMATRSIKLEGDDFRNEVREAKNKVAKKLGI